MNKFNAHINKLQEIATGLVELIRVPKLTEPQNVIESTWSWKRHKLISVTENTEVWQYLVTFVSSIVVFL